MVQIRSVILATLLATAPAVAADTTAPEQPPAHQHGAASLQEGPSDNLLGFEHAPRNDAEKQTVARAESQLKKPVQLVGTPPAAECQPQPARVDMKLPAAGSGETHSEVEAEWRWDCGKPDALTQVDVSGLFKAFPRLKQLKVQVVTARGQKTAVLKPGAARLKIAS
jgi:cell wall-associated NlpC family hydrolase